MLGILGKVKNTINDGMDIVNKQKNEKKLEKERAKQERLAEKVKEKRQKKEATEAFKEYVMEEQQAKRGNFVVLLDGHDFVLDKAVTSGQAMGGLFVDDTNKKFAVAFFTGTRRAIKFYTYSDLLNFELNEDGNSVIQGKTAATVVGGVLFGEAGALAGAAGKRKTQSTCSSMSLRLLLNDLKTPERTFRFIDIETEKSSVDYQTAIHKARELTAVLTYIQNNA